jgi:hypothetical protein
MGARLVLSALFVFSLSLLRSQADSVLYRPDARMPDGIYLTYDDFRKNRPITKEQIVTRIDKEQLEFIGKTMFEEKLTFNRNDSVITMLTKNAWGYFQNNTLYLNFKDEFYRVPVFGSISYLVANVTVMTTGFYDPRFGTTGGSSNTREIREFLMNFYDGVVTEFTVQTFEELLARDPELYAEFKKLTRRKQKEELYRYIRKYNERHPVYFLK